MHLLQSARRSHHGHFSKGGWIVKKNSLLKIMMKRNILIFALSV